MQRVGAGVTYLGPAMELTIPDVGVFAPGQPIPAGLDARIVGGLKASGHSFDGAGHIPAYQKALAGYAPATPGGEPEPVLIETPFDAAPPATAHYVEESPEASEARAREAAKAARGGAASPER